MVTTANTKNLPQYQIRFSLIEEHKLAFTRRIIDLVVTKYFDLEQY